MKVGLFVTNQQTLDTDMVSPTFSTGASEGVRGPAKRRFGWKGLHYIRGAGPAMWLAAVMRGGGCGGNIRLS